MIEEIKRLYHEFGDAVINRVVVLKNHKSNDGEAVSIYMTCLNWETEKWQEIELRLQGVSHFQYFKSWKTQDSVVFEALVREDESGIIVDFFPVQADEFRKLIEDPKSDFLVRCASLSYEVVRNF